MDGITIGLTVGGIIVGAVITYIVSKYFFNKSLKEKSLTPFLQFTSRLFSDLDPELKEELIVTYKDHKIDNINQVQFLIANDGDIPIKDIIEPLRLIIPKENRVFSANIIHIEPEGRNIDYEIIETEDQNIIEFSIPLLNSGEFFVVKLLLQDSLPSESKEEKEKQNKITYSFTITADDLQPNLKISRLPYSYYEEEKKKKYNWTGFWFGIIFGVLLTAIIGIIYSFKHFAKELYLFSFNNFFNGETFSIYNVFILLLALLAIVFLLITIVGIVQAISELTPNKKPKFKVPSKLRKGRARSYPFEIFD
ncbi:hypothetical protein ACNR9Q_00430 [Maribacter sp. X9]|uniref:hypothetical protein n=1 Tax=Maribacter sp. X9 TaxID=3402159 RepID=UPI003AF38AF9